MVAKVDTAEESMALARLGQGGGGLWGRVHEDGCIVAEDTGQDLLGRWVSHCLLQCFGSSRLHTITTEMGKRIQ